MRSGGMPAGSSRALRLDPFSLPARFAAIDAAADERVRHVELYRERVVVRRSLGGMRMALNMPVSAFTGVAIRVLAGESDAEASVSVTLEHKDPSLALPLFTSGEADEAFAEWPAWVACVSNGYIRAAAAAARSSAAGPRCRCAARRASSPARRRCIAASARSSREINRSGAAARSLSRSRKPLPPYRSDARAYPMISSAGFL